MQTQPTTITPDDAYYVAILQELVDGAATLARRVLEESAAAPTAQNPTPAADATTPYDRIARTIRRTVALARFVAEGRHHAAQQRAARRAQVIRGVEDAIHRKHRGRDGRDRDRDAEALHAELAERLEDPASEFDFEGRDVQDIIDEITRDLGVAQQGRAYVWQRRTPADIQDLRTRAAQNPPPCVSEGPGVGPTMTPKQASPTPPHP